MIFSPLVSPLFRKFFSPLSLGLMLALLFVSLRPPALRAADTNAVAGTPADQAWQALQHARETPPEPLKEPTDHMLSQQEIKDYYALVAEQAGAVADEAKQFYTRYPDHAQADRAREIYFNSLHTAVEYGSTNKIAELEAVTAERLKDPKLDDDARFQLSLHLLHSAVSGRNRKYLSDDAVRAELEIRAWQLARAYPNHPEGYNYLMNLARAAAPEKSAALAREILASNQDEKIKNECQGLINRTTALNQPLDLTLALTNGRLLDLAKLRGRVVLLLFWDSSSRYSAKALWVVNELYKTYHPQGAEAGAPDAKRPADQANALAVVGLNFDEDPAQAQAMLKDNKVEWPQYLDVPAGRTVQNRFGVHTLPMCWILDKKGVLRELKGESDPQGIIKRLQAE